MSSEQFIQGIIGGLAIGCIYSLIALGITIIIRATEILHFAQGELMMIGAMAGLSAMWMVDLPFVVVLLVGMIGAWAVLSGWVGRAWSVVSSWLAG